MKSDDINIIKLDGDSAYLLASPKNKKRLLSSLAHARVGKETKKELNKWEKGVNLALNDKEYMSHSKK